MSEGVPIEPKHKLYSVTFNHADIVYQQEPGLTPIHVSFLLNPVETMDKEKRYLVVDQYGNWEIASADCNLDGSLYWETLEGRVYEELRGVGGIHPNTKIKGWALELPDL